MLNRHERLRVHPGEYRASEPPTKTAPGKNAISQRSSSGEKKKRFGGLRRNKYARRHNRSQPAGWGVCVCVAGGDSPWGLQPVDRLQPFSVAIQATVTKHPSGLNSQCTRKKGKRRKSTRMINVAPVWQGSFITRTYTRKHKQRGGQRFRCVRA